MKRIQTIGLWAARRTLFVLWSCGWSSAESSGRRAGAAAAGSIGVSGVASLKCGMCVASSRGVCRNYLYSRTASLLPALAYLLNLRACAGWICCSPTCRPWALPRCCFIDKYLHKCENFITPLCLYLNYFLRFLRSLSVSSVLPALNTLHTQTHTPASIFYLTIRLLSWHSFVSLVGDLSSVLSLPARPIYLSNLGACGFNYSYKYVYACVCAAWVVCRVASRWS